MVAWLGDLAGRRQALVRQIDEVHALWESMPGGAAGGLVEADLLQVRNELQQHRFTVGLFGLIKRGKSTLINSLLGAEVSVTHATPETAVPVYIEHGDRLSAHVHLGSGEVLAVAPTEVVEWTSQKHNPRNFKGVTHVQWSLPSPLLRNGVRLVDTPGLDDAEADELYTERTVQELDAADAGIVVFLSPPTVGASEMAFLRNVASAQLEKTLLVANMYPQHFHDPDKRAAVLRYVSERISDATGVSDAQVHAVCALEAWQARQLGDLDAFEAAGGAHLLAAVEQVVEQQTGAKLLARAERRLRETVEVAAAETALLARAVAGEAATSREQIDVRLSELATAAEARLRRELDEVAGLRANLHAAIHGAFVTARRSIAAARSVEELDATLARFRRKAEVVAERSYRVVKQRIATVEEDMTAALDEEMSATLLDLGAPGPSRHVDLTETVSPARPGGRVGTAAVSGLAGGAGVALVAVALGPIGLLAGALVGWRVSGALQHGRALQPARLAVDAHLCEVAETLLDEFDRRSEILVETVRVRAEQRRLALGHDLRTTLEVGFLSGGDLQLRAQALAAIDEVTRGLDRITGAAAPTLVLGRRETP